METHKTLTFTFRQTVRSPSLAVIPKNKGTLSCTHTRQQLVSQPFSRSCWSLQDTFIFVAVFSPPHL